MKCVEFWYDVETSGLTVESGAVVLQFAAQVVVNDEVVKEFDFYIDPESYGRPYYISPDALKVNKINPKDFETFGQLSDIVAMITNYIKQEFPKEKMILVGYNNSTFDKYFIEDMFKCAGVNFNTYFKWKQIDVFELVKGLQHMGVLGKTFNQKLTTVAEAYLELEPVNAHNALIDVTLTRGVYKYIEKVIKNV